MKGLMRVTRILALAMVAVALMFALQANAQMMNVVGEAKLKVMFWDVYYSRLYSPSGRYVDGQRPIKLEIEYLMDIDAEDLISRTKEEWKHLGVNHPNQVLWLQTLEMMWPDITENDRLAIVIDDAGHSLFLLNNTPIGRVEDPDFGQHFVDIWLSPNTSRPQLRLALLGAE
ncbi:chalcone isomerase family protein [Corallincola spongiicola]|uniref:Chalcone isomerase domain-containing protein n=1 Tax=Corallincola spongiicola TaxID=2520508 RepID=A0ABY1WQN9_9GAMM|nr:chalcone isomerase family protein [Corallincola spongiicola]TAA46955.1 hypothetical protein EXY25_06785 [Corallincola spongiicola]